MLHPWMEVLPLFVTRWLAKRYCERVLTPTSIFATARPDVLIGLK